MTDQPALHRRVVRALASGRVHVVDVPRAAFTVFRWIGPPCIGVALPVATLCTATLRGRDSVAVCMEPGTRVTCRTCARLAGVDRADDHNDRHPNGLDGPGAWAAAQSAGEAL